MAVAFAAVPHLLSLTIIAPHNPKRFDLSRVWARSGQCQTQKIRIIPCFSLDLDFSKRYDFDLSLSNGE